MKAYDVYRHSTRGFQSVKEGFSWPAFFFPVLWSLAKGLRLYALGFFAIGLVLQAMQASAGAGSPAAGFVTLLQLALSVVVGFNGNNWLRASLERRGFDKVATVEAGTPAAAISKVVAPAPAVAQAA